MRTECGRTGRTFLYDLFDARVLAPAMEGKAAEGYETLTQRLGLRSAVEAANLLVTCKRMFARHLREVVSEYAGPAPGEVDREVADLRRILAGAPSTRGA
jgi:hypothetical protein